MEEAEARINEFLEEKVTGDHEEKDKKRIAPIVPVRTREPWWLP